jgi:hypothetical protein
LRATPCYRDPGNWPDRVRATNIERARARGGHGRAARPTGQERRYAAAVAIAETRTWKHDFSCWNDLMLGIEKRYVERTARTRSTWFVNQLIFGNFAGALVFLFGAFAIWTGAKSPADIFGALLFLAGFPAGLRFSYLGWRAAQRQKELNMR